MLRDFYAQYPANQTIPVRDIAAILGKPAGTVRARAHTLGISEPGRPRRSPPRHRLPFPCPVCGENFTPVARSGSTIRTCSISCGRKLAIREHGHPRGASGIQHSDTARAAISAASRAMWSEMPDDERSKRAETARAMAANRVTTAERTHTRARGGRRADLDNRYFRSAWEANYARWLNYRVDHSDGVEWWTYEPRTFRFPVKRGTMSYTPDFLVTFRDGHVEWHEVKGWLTPQGATALKRFAKYYPAERLVLVDGPAYKAIAQTARGLLEVWE